MSTIATTNFSKNAATGVYQPGANGYGYQEVPASSSATVLGVAGAKGDIIKRLIIVPATTSPGHVEIQDGTNTAIVLFAGGATSVADLGPIVVDLDIASLEDGWFLTTGANVSVVAVGSFT
jgi:hypothetical protein